MCTAPAVWPQMITEFWMFFKYSAEKGALVVGAERSMTQRWRFDIVPELVACAADAGSSRWRSAWFVTMVLVVAESDGRRTPGPSGMPSDATSSSIFFVDVRGSTGFCA